MTTDTNNIELTAEQRAEVERLKSDPDTVVVLVTESFAFALNDELYTVSTWLVFYNHELQHFSEGEVLSVEESNETEDGHGVWMKGALFMVSQEELIDSLPLLRL